MQGLRPLFLLRSRLAPKQTSASRLRRRNSLRASGLHHSKKNHENRLARSLCPTKKYDLSNFQTYKTYFKIMSAEGSGPPAAIACFQGFPLCQRHHPTEEGLPFAGWRRLEAKPLTSLHPANGKGLWPLTLIQRIFLVLVLKLKCTGLSGARFFLVHHIELSFFKYGWHLKKKRWKRKKRGSNPYWIAVS